MQQLSLHLGPATRVRIAHGPLATEALLLEELGAALGDTEQLLDEPLLLVVPSASLRRHLVARLLAESRRGALVGFDCRTHLGLAATVIERCDGFEPAGRDGVDFFSLFARRLARCEGALAESLDHLRDGYGSALAAVRDLLDAGFEPELVEGLDEVLVAEGPPVASRQEVDRARALLRVAAGTRRELDRWGLGRSSDLLSQATLAVRQRPLRIGRVVVYGFSDATGLTTDFLLALLGTYGGTLYLDEPHDPADRRRVEPGRDFSRTYRERIEAAVPEVERSPPGVQVEPRVESFRALGAEAEVCEAGRRIQRLIAAGTRPEEIGLVVRRLEDYVGHLRVQFQRLALPFSADRKCGPFTPRAAPLHALLALLRERQRLPVERWLETAVLARGWIARADLLAGLRTLGAGRLGEVARLEVESIERRGGLKLPVVRGFEPSEAESGAYRPVHRWLGAESLQRAVAAARAVCAALENWPRVAAAGQHALRLEALACDDLGWRPSQPPWADALSELRRVAGALPTELETDFDELQLVLARELADYGRDDVGGRGGGVKVLDVTAARSLTFEHLFVLGLNRGVFPRQVREDPVLTDPLRRVLARSGFGLLPDLPVKASGFSEERYLFAQLLSASPRITLSWPEVDDQQKNPRAVSPLVERLQLATATNQASGIPVARPVFAPAGDRPDARPAWETAVLAGLAGDRPTLQQVLRVALAGEEAPADKLARARIAAIDEIDPPPRAGGRDLGNLGPWLGAVGEIASASDPRRSSEHWVTNLEKLARCPWQHFLTRVLRIDSPPDPLDAVPGVDPLLIGSVVHDALAAIVDRVLTDAEAHDGESLTAPGTPVPWPDDGELKQILRRVAGEVVRRRDLGLPGLDRALARVAAEHLATARSEDWPNGVSRWPVIGAEVEGSFDLAEADGTDHRIRFRADRLDRSDTGLAFTDYKTGATRPTGSPSSTAGQRLLEGVRSGEWLQAAAYALAGRGQPSRGRYLFVRPDLVDGFREYSVHSDQAALQESLPTTLRTLLALWHQGRLFPRLLDSKGNEPARCGFCDVSVACLRGDSGARRRLVEHIETCRRRDTNPPPQTALVAAWDLGRRAKSAKGRK